MRLKSVFVLGLTLVLISLAVVPMAVSAAGLSAGCAQINVDGVATTDMDFTGTYVLNAGEVITVTQISDPGAENEQYTIKDMTAVVTLAGPATGNGSITWVVPADGSYKLQLGYAFGNSNITSNATCAAGGAVGGAAGDTLLRTVTAWGVGGARAIVWQWQNGGDSWWWITVPSTVKKLETAIEYRDRVAGDGSIVNNYPLSRITVSKYALPNDPSMFRVYNADTLEEMHGIWIEIGDEGDPNRLSVFIP